MLKSILRIRHSAISISRNTLSSAPFRGICISAKHLTSNGDDSLSTGIELGARIKHHNPFAERTTLPQGQIDVSEPKMDEQKKLKVLQLEVDIANQEGRRVPSLDFLQEHHWQHILTLPSKSARIKYYAFLWQIEMKKESEKRKKSLRAEESIRRVAEIREERKQNNHIIYGLAHTSMFLRIYDTAINHWQNNRLIRAMRFEPKLLLDCSYDAHMNNREASYAAKQLMLCFAENRANEQPFDLHYCNVNMESPSIQGLKRYIPTMLSPEFPMNVHNNCFTELFPKENLVYLTPHCRDELLSYNPDDIYIVGAMVDTMNNEPLSLAKAKRLGLRMARLPLDRYLQWGSGSGKSLTLNQMINIMLALKNTGDWEKALQHVPRRKVIDMTAQQFQERKVITRHADRLNVRVNDLLGSKNKWTVSSTPEKLRLPREHTEFDINSWATGKKKRSQSR